MTAFAFYALGIPAPQGSKRHVGHGVMVEASKKTRPWRSAVLDACPAIATPLDGPLAVRMVFTVPRPKTAPKRLLRPFTTPDLSKLARAVEDSITDAGLWADDARVCEYVRLAKVWAWFDAEALPVPGVIVACVELDDPAAEAEVNYEARLWGLFHDTRNAAHERVRGVA
jgi:Holliday junction resolvase RusA-like endonuclease